MPRVRGLYPTKKTSRKGHIALCHKSSSKIPPVSKQTTSIGKQKEQKTNVELKGKQG